MRGFSIDSQLQCQIITGIITDEQIINEISERCIVSQNIATGLAKKWIKVTIEENEYLLIERFLDPEFLELFTSDLWQTNAISSSAYLHLLDLINKSVYFIKKYSINEFACDFISNYHYVEVQTPYFKILNIFNLPVFSGDPLNEYTSYAEESSTINNSDKHSEPTVRSSTRPPNSGEPSWLELWYVLDNSYSYNNAFAKGTYSLFEVWDMCFIPNLEVNSILEKLAIITGWNYTDVHYLKGVTENPLSLESLQNVAWVKRLSDQLYLSAISGVSPYSIIRVNYPEPGKNQALKLRSVVKNKYSRKQWLEIAKSIMDPLRIQLRDVFLDYLVNRGFDLPDNVHIDFDSVNSLYDYFLIDSLMNPCAMTSRVVQATMSIQVLIQRILLCLETDISLEANQQGQWSWYKNYRVWEACRKAFLYPENWLEPEWRKGKSEIFSQLEDYLKQNDVTSESSEKAYLNYVGKLNELSDLEVISIFREGTSDEIDKIHYLGRTRSLPHIHYYRMCKNASFENAEWTPWEKVEIDIESESATLAVVNDVVFIIWPFLISKAIEHPTKETSPGYEVRVAFTQKKNNVWNRKYVSETGLTGFNDGNFLYYNVMDITSDGEIQLALISDCQEYELAKGFPLIKLNGEVVYRNLDIQKSGYLHTPGSFRGGKLLVSSTAGKVTIHNSYNSGSPIEITSSSSAGENDFLAVGNMIAYSTTDPSTFLNGYTLLLPLVYKNNKADWYGIPIIVYGKKFIYQNQFRNLLSKSLDLINTTDTSVEFWNEDSSFHYSTQEHKIIISSSKSNDEIKVNEPLENVNRNQVVLKYKMYAFNHLFAAQLIDKIFKEGVLSISNQDQNNIFFRQKASSELNHGISLGFDSWAAKNNVEIDFYKSYPYSLYNWELFFHIPMLIASRLSANLQFEDAQKWYHLIFDPTNKLDQSNDFEVAHPWLRVWKFKPFYTILKEVNIREILYHTSLSGYYSNQIDDWKDDPLNTFSLAEERIYPYMRNVVMKYLDNLFAWGDYLFSQDTMESLNEATQLYILAAEILGPRPVIVDTTLPEEVSFVGLGDELDAFSNKLFPIESFAAGCRNGELFDKELATPSTNPLSKSTVESLYFEIPYNGKLITYWDTVEDRLFKLRNCMNLKGSIRELPLFQPPIDPALLIQASQAGLDFSQIVAGLNLPASCYRYRVLSQKAKELANEVVSLGSSLLSAMEKKDAETIALLRNSQEKALLKVITSVKEQAINESQASIDSLELSIANAQDRLTYYSGRPYMNDREKANLHNTALASDYQSESQDLHSLASILGAFPQIHVGVAAASEQGGIQLSVIPMMAAMIKDSLSSYYQYRAQVSAITGGYDRRQDDWKFQASQATGEVNSLQKQLIGAKVRLAIAQKELSNHELQIQHADDNYTFLKEKFTNEQLYEWMVSELSSVYFQSYKLAVDYAHQAEKAFRFETSTSSTTDIIDYNHWDNLREGLMAGERLRLELNLLDKEYLDKNIRNLEITKNISLALINPSALGELRVRGYCEISIPEYLFDLDYPGQYSRRIKSVAISIPAVSAPNANISCKLTLRSSCYRFDTRCPDPGQNGRTAYDQIDSDTRFVYNPITSQSIATSSAMNDRGVFDFNFNDERYLPFEGAGVISSWKLELPEQFRQFDYDSITDVVLHISYSALDAGEILKSKALESLTYAMEHGLASGTLMALPLEWKAEFVDELFQVQNENAHSSQFVLGLKHFPTFVQDYLTKNSSIHLKIKSVDFIVKGENLTTLCLKKFSPSDPVTKNFTPYINSGYSYTRIIKTDGNNNDLPLDWQLNNSGTPFELTISESTGVSIENIWMIVNYTCS